MAVCFALNNPMAVFTSSRLCTVAVGVPSGDGKIFCGKRERSQKTQVDTCDLGVLSLHLRENEERVFSPLAGGPVPIFADESVDARSVFFSLVSVNPLLGIPALRRHDPIEIKSFAYLKSRRFKI
jgi:hypothetical protein